MKLETFRQTISETYYKRLRLKLKSLLKDKYLVSVLFLLVCGAVLRFYRLPEFMTFLGDQGRDAIVIKRILTFEHFPAIGAPTSVGQVYLGPFYYYFIAPWLLLSNFNPIGLAVGVAFFSTLFIIIYYFGIKKIISKNTALISTIFITFSVVLINLSRFSWNPNLLPLFSFLYFFYFIYGWDKKNKYFIAVAGALLSFCIQLHYLALFLIFPSVVLLFYELKASRSLKIFINKAKYMLLTFAFFSLPLLIFDLRHQFLNTKNFFKFFTEKSQSSPDLIGSTLNTYIDLFSYSLPFELPAVVILVIAGSYLYSVLYMFVTGTDNLFKKISLFCSILFLSLFLYRGPWYEHYFGFVYPFVYLYFGVIFSNLISKSKYYLYIVSLLLAIFIISSAQRYSFIRSAGGEQSVKAKKIAKVIYEHVKEDKYRLTSLPERYSESTYRYYLEIWKKRPIEKDSIEHTNEMFVVCDNKCNPIDDPQWDVAVFAAKKIINSWEVSGVNIYQLTNIK